MATRVNKWVAQFEVGEVVPQHICQWDARVADEDTDWVAWGKRRFDQGPSGGNWWVHGWEYMTAKGKVKGAAIRVTCDPRLLDEYIEPPFNEWGEVCP